MNKIKGLGVALVTPFNTDLSIDFLALENLINLQIESGVDYIVLLGTTAESVVLSKSEKLEIISFSKKIISSRITLVLGIGGNDTLSLVEEINNTNFTGIDAVLSVSPYYNKPSQDGIYEHYKMISKACPVPIIIYNVPSRTSIDISIMTTLRLANNFKNIVAIKEASGNIDKISRIINEKPSNFVVLSGDDALTFPLICLGAEGVISVVGQSFPSDYGAMVRSAINGDFIKAKQIHYNIYDYYQPLYMEGNPVGVKALLESQNICKAVVRPPLIEASQSIKNQFKNLLKK